MNHNSEQSADERDAALGDEYDALRDEFKLMLEQRDGYRDSLNNLRVAADALSISLEQERREAFEMRAVIRDLLGWMDFVEGENNVLRDSVSRAHAILTRKQGTTQEGA